MISRIKSILYNNNKIFENFSYLALAKIFNLILPLIIFPYLVKVLGAKLYGEIVYAQVIATYFTIIINYGFNVSGARDVAQCREDISQLSRVVSTIMFIQLIFFLVSLMFLIVVLFLLDLDRNTFLLYLFSFFICLNSLLFPQWFFQGIEKIKYTTVINLLMQGFFLLLIFTLVKTQSDFLLVPILNAIGATLAGIASLYVLIYREKIYFVIPSWTDINYYMKLNFSLFLSELIISVKDRFGIILIGRFLGMSEVAIYDFGIKIAGLFIALIGVINTAVFPKMAIEKNKNLLKVVIKYSFLLILFSIVIVEIFLPLIIRVASIDLKDAEITIRILLISPILFSLSLPLARNGLIAFGYDRLFLFGMFITTIFYIILTSIGYFFEILNNVQSFAIITLLVYAIELLYRFIICKRLKII